MEAKKRLEELFNFVGLLAMTSEPTEVASLRQMMASHLKDISEAASAIPLPSIVDRSDKMSKALMELAFNDLIASINDFSSWAQEHLHQGGSVSESQNIFTSHEDISASLDTELLVEFIEKHASALDEFEGTLLAANDTDTVGDAEVQNHVKGYIHNLKGDAGSIGLTGIERACHFVEDLVISKGVPSLFDQLLSFKEWVATWLTALSQSKAASVSAKEFQSSFLGSLNTEEETSVAPTRIDEMSCANLDLLAELLADETEKVDAAETDEYPLEGDTDVFVEFAAEAEDHLNIVETTLLDGAGSYDKDAIDTIFRGIHSIKGASSYFSLLEVTETSHLTENLLDEVRSGKRELDQGLVELVLEFVDLQRNLLKNARTAMNDQSLIHRIPQSAEYLEQLRSYQSASGTGATTRVAKATPKPIERQPQTNIAEEQGAKTEKLDIKNYVKVETDRLDQLIDSIGEMSIYSSMLIQNCRELFADNEHLIKVTHQVEKFGRELQHIGMSMRLIPIRGLFQKMSRLVWDVAKKIGKEVKFSMEGEDTELDRTIIEKLADPLMHMIRNALDHGVETPAEREAAGKPRAGTVQLKAFHSGGNIHIQIIDDGRGLNPEKLIKKAQEKGILSEGQRISDNEAYHLIFAPGFSTAAVVTDISGRGVGMDVVRRNIESMRGRVHISSKLGEGTTFTIELPLTLAIIDGIQLKVGPECFIVPTLSVVEFIRPSEGLTTRTLDRGETFSFRGKYLPVYRLGELFNVPTDHTAQGLYVVVETNGEMFTIVVDDIVSTHSTVIKNIGDMFGQNKGIAGCAIMPDGDVALILDLRSLLEAARGNYRFETVETSFERTTTTSRIQ